MTTATPKATTTAAMTAAGTFQLGGGITRVVAAVTALRHQS